MVEKASGNFAEVRTRLKAGKLTKDDVSSLEKLVKDAESAIRKLRAAVVE